MGIHRKHYGGESKNILRSMTLGPYILFFPHLCFFRANQSEFLLVRRCKSCDDWAINSRCTFIHKLQRYYQGF